VGILNVSTGRPIPFAPREIELLQAIGNVIGVALENARLFGETRRTLEGVRALREIDQAITSTLHLETVLNVLLEKIDLFHPHCAATIRLLNEESGLLEPVACRNLDEKEWKVEKWRGGRGLANAVFETKTPVIIRNAQTDPRVLDQEFYRKHRLVTYLGVPLIAKDQALGVLNFYTKREQEITNEEVEFLSTIAGQTAIAIHNSQLYERLKKQAIELVTANKVKDEFLSVMSHELRTPLNVVVGYTELMRDQMLGRVSKEQKRALGKVIGRSKDLLDMIDSVLQATSIEAGTVEVESQEVHLGAFLGDLKTLYDAPLDNGTNLVWDIPSFLPSVKTDGEKLKRILQNLIHNAIKFTSKGLVTASVRNISSAKTVEFKVTDTGIGIPQEMQSTIFKMFRQGDSSETRPYGGVGLGLYIARRLTEMLRGTIAVESRPGEGSSFTVAIPCETFEAVGIREDHKEQAY
jgi:signal transduction histidine kinase